MEVADLLSSSTRYVLLSKVTEITCFSRFTPQVSKWRWSHFDGSKTPL